MPAAGPGSVFGNNADEFVEYGNGGYVGWKTVDYYYNGDYIGSQAYVGFNSGGYLNYTNATGAMSDVYGAARVTGFFTSDGRFIKLGFGGGQTLGHNANWWVF